MQLLPLPGKFLLFFQLGMIEFGYFSSISLAFAPFHFISILGVVK
jgi:hypothetical protein